MGKKINRRDFLKRLGLGTGAIAATSAIVGCGSEVMNKMGANLSEEYSEMAYRTNPKTGEKVSLLGYGCMRWPTTTNRSAREGGDDEVIDQDQVNRLVDYAIEHGVNYFDTSPAYCKGKSEEATGIALSRHDRSKYYIATKMSNFAPETWPREESIKIYKNSMEQLRTENIDYMLLHCIGTGSKDLDGNDLDGMETFKRRFVDNGILDYLVAERDAGRIGNLGFSYHGDIAVFDYLLSQHDKYKWDFVQIQMNYIDWKYAKTRNERETNGEYLYDELDKRGIPAVIMEPLLGGRLAKVPDYAMERMKKADPEKSPASWAFRYAGSFPRILTVLSGMTFMEHLKDNLHAYAPFVELTDEEKDMLYDIAKDYIESPYLPCTNCQYCMPCPYGIDIPSIFAHYNRMVSERYYDSKVTDPNYKEARKAFLVGYDRSVPSLRQASHCIGCKQCVHHCPQRIAIPDELHKIDQYVETLKRDNQA